MRPLAVVLLVVAALPASAQDENAAAITRGQKWLAARKAFDEGHLGRRTYGVYKGTDHLGNIVVIVSKTKYRGKPEYRLQNQLNIEVPGSANYHGNSEARITLGLTLRTCKGEFGVESKRNEAQTIYSAARKSKGVLWQGGPEEKQERKGLTPKNVVLEGLAMSFPRAMKSLPEGKYVKLPTLDADKGEIKWIAYLRGKLTDMKVGEKTIKVMPFDVSGKTPTKVYLDPKTGDLIAMQAYGLTYKPETGEKSTAPAGPQPKDTVGRMLIALAKKDTPGYLACFDVKEYQLHTARREAGSPELVDSAEADVEEAWEKAGANKMRSKFAKKSMSSVNEWRKEMPTDIKTWRVHSEQEVKENKAVVHVKYGELDLTYELQKRKKRWVIVGRR